MEFMSEEKVLINHDFYYKKWEILNQMEHLGFREFKQSHEYENFLSDGNVDENLKNSIVEVVDYIESYGFCFGTMGFHLDSYSLFHQFDYDTELLKEYFNRILEQSENEHFKVQVDILNIISTMINSKKQYQDLLNGVDIREVFERITSNMRTMIVRYDMEKRFEGFLADYFSKDLQSDIFLNFSRVKQSLEYMVDDDMRLNYDNFNKISLYEISKNLFTAYYRLNFKIGYYKDELSPHVKKLDLGLWNKLNEFIKDIEQTYVDSRILCELASYTEDEKQNKRKHS